MPSSISIKGILIAAAAIVAVIVAAVAAFFLLRPNPPQQTAAQQSPTTAASPALGATPTGGAESSAGWSGEYQLTSQELVENDSGTCNRGPWPGSFSVRVTSATITFLAGPGLTLPMTAPDTFSFTKTDWATDTWNGNFTRVDNVATLNMTYRQSIPTGDACGYRITATRRS